MPFLQSSKRTVSILTLGKLNDPSLLHQKSFVDGKWVEAKSGERFDVKGSSSMTQQQYTMVLNIDANLC
jgi:hypothetical protein